MGWSGAVTGSSPNETFSINKPQSVTAIWSTDYSGMYIPLIVLAVIGIAGIYVAIKVLNRKDRNNHRNANQLTRDEDIEGKTRDEKEVQTY